MQIQTTSMPNEIRNALPHSDWDKVYELISRNRKLKQQLNDKIDLSDFGHQIYGHHDAPIDPFFPGMHKLANLTTEQLEREVSRVEGQNHPLTLNQIWMDIVHHQKSGNLQSSNNYSL
ncbi:MAG: hypothetical protein B6I37_01180 [Desulfobacteraceae bacterium 4572_35.2]|nr:MAG: hypothetical protein B6I37_01180 [Desulfobacteraceae bacterium 4572_35.2]